MQYLIDASVYVFRAYYSMPDDMVDDNGNPVNALYGFCRFLGDFMEQVTPEYVAVLFDESMTESFRTEIYPLYKANRDPAPADLKRQFEQCRRYVRALGVMEQRLRDHDFVAGGKFTIADIALFAYTHVADEGGFDLRDYPAVLDWIERVRSRPGHTPMEFK